MEASHKDSDTEVNVFRVVANPSKINTEARPPTSAAEPVAVAQPPVAAVRPSMPVRTIPRMTNASESARITPPVTKPSESLFRDAVKVQAQGTDTPAKPFPTSSATAPAPAPIPVHSAPQSSRSGDKPDVVLEKQATLMEIEQLRSQGSVITRRFTMDDSLQSMQFEVRKHLMSSNESRTMNMMSDGMKLMFTGLEMANSKLGPVLDLDGWAAEITHDMSRFDPPLRRLYRKYWRRTQLSAEYELLFAIMSSMVMFHFSKKFYGGGASSAQQPNSGMPDPSMFANMFGGNNAQPSSAPPDEPKSQPSFRGNEAPPPAFD